MNSSYKLSGVSSGITNAAQQQQQHAAEQGEYGWATLNAAFTFLGASELRWLATGRSLMPTQLSEVWKQSSLGRNIYLKNALFKTLYKGANDLAIARNGAFPVIDFLENWTGIAFRSVDDFASAEKGLLQAIDDLSNVKKVGCLAGVTGEVKVSSVRLDVGVKKGLGEVPASVKAHAQGKGVALRMLEIVEEAGEIVANGIKAGKFTVQQIDDYVKFATKNAEAKKVMLGKYDEPGTLSYIERAGKDHTYFDMGSTKWDDARKLVNNGVDDSWKTEMWRINKEFIDQQKALGKEFYFSHEPWKSTSKEFLSKEAEYLIDLGAKDFVKINENTWKVIW